MSNNTNLNVADLKKIINEFGTFGIVEQMETFGNGLINNTYRVSVFDGFETDEYIIQRINTNVFKDVKGLMNNIDIVTSHIENKLLSAGKRSSRGTIKMKKRKNGQNFIETENGVFRIYKSIENASTYDVPENEKAVELTGVAFGEFHKQLMDLDSTRLVETIPNFHNTKLKYNAFAEAVEENKVGRLEKVLPMVKFAQERSDFSSLIIDRVKNGLPIRVTHNDPKFNNILFDNDSNKPIAIIDLDTMMPGPIAYDFGDAVRSACNTSSENETDLSKVEFDIQKFNAFTKGYLNAIQDEITEKEISSLVDGCLTITYELGLRFLTDYLNGDKYFKTDYPEHNLQRAAVQFKLLSSMEKQKSLMQKSVFEHSNQVFL